MALTPEGLLPWSVSEKDMALADKLIQWIDIVVSTNKVY